MRTLPVVVLLLLVTAACGASSGSTMAVKTTGAEVSSLAHYRTYVHETAESPPEGFARGALRPVVLEKVRRDVDALLQAKGYVLDPGGELVVRISTGSRIVEDQPTGAAAIAGAPEKTEMEGALVIDIVERATDKTLFHGFARDVVPGGDVKDERVSQAVTRILQPIPVSASAR